MPSRYRRRAGVTLTELLVVVAVLAIAARVALPRADPASSFTADAVAAEVAHALRFAQREAVRTGAWHRVSIDTASQQLRVARLDISGAVAEDGSNKALHPLDKREYRVTLGAAGALRARVASAVFTYNSGTTLNTLSFSPDGAPADIRGSLVKTIDPLKADGVVTVRDGQAARTVTVDAVTARVTF